MSRDVDFPADASGHQACQVCGASVVGTAFVLLRDVVAYDGVHGHSVYRWDGDVVDERDPDYDESASHYVGPVLHVETCLAQYAWGLCAEVRVRVVEQKKRGKTRDG